MPNHIKNVIELDGSISDIDEMIKQFSTYRAAKLSMTHDGKEVICKSFEHNYCWLDLSNGYCHSRSGINQIGLPDGYAPQIDDAVLIFPDFEKVIPPPDDPAYKDLPSQDVAKQSPNWWYNWNVNNWGSKWGGYSYERLGLVSFSFETAWSSCPLIIKAMSKRFPNVRISYKWADEDTGHNCGCASYLGGIALWEDVPKGGSKEAYELAFELRPNRKQNYELIDGNYKYTESE